jgi:hypothetical protein
MSSKKKKEEEYKSDEDEDFVPDSKDLEEQGEVYMDENEEEVPVFQSRKMKKKGKRKADLSARVVRKGPFDSDDGLSESESIPSDDESQEPISKKPKLEEPEDQSTFQASKPNSSAVDDFYAQMMRGRAPKTKTQPPAPVPAQNSPAPSKPANTSPGVAESAAESSDPLAFFAMMKKGSANSKSSSASTTTSTGKLAMPASWLQSKKDNAVVDTETSADASLSTGSSKIAVKQRYEFAGEQIEVEHLLDAKEAAELKAAQSVSGLGSLLDQLKGKNKITTLQKSKLDWNQFTDQEGLEDEFTKNRKDGYIQKQEFLQNAEAAETAAYLAGKARARR